MTSDPIINEVDEQFINDIKENCVSPLIWETTAHIIQKYIKELVHHEIDVITDSDWFDQKIKDAVEDTTDSQEWVKSAKVAAYLNISVPYFHQKAKILEEKGILKQSTHYFRTGNSSSSPYRWNLTKTAKVFKENVN